LPEQLIALARTIKILIKGNILKRKEYEKWNQKKIK
jgi:hypothetical protein